MELSLQHSCVDDNPLAPVAAVCIAGAVRVSAAQHSDHVLGVLADSDLPLLAHLLQALGGERKVFSTK